MTIRLIKHPSNIATAFLAGTAALLSASFSTPASAEVAMGDLSVQSQRGQRLKVALPYGSGPAERVPLMRFTVEDVKVPDGFVAPSPRSFMMMQGENRNVVTMLSREPFDAPSVTMVIKVANQPNNATRSFTVAVPQAQTAAYEAPEADAAKPKATKGKKQRSYKRKISVQNDLPPK
jgi:hypothetical protein